ncbi:MAG: dihydrolipoyl dehydrogenase [Salinisphaeraceae bacterium]|nr:dihydrolipoyl dehydrogenase [Salinisphaeraceae bacterium]
MSDKGKQISAQVVVLGSGPGGYTAAFRAADLGLETVLIERHSSLGGVCLNVGCIPSKALLHTAHIIDEAEAMAAHGVSFGKPQIDLEKLRGFKQSVVEKLTGGLKGLAKQRKVQVVTGEGFFVNDHELKVETDDGSTVVRFEHCIIAAGSQSISLPNFPDDDPRLIDSTGALELEDIPEEMLVIGGGIIGLEMANVYSVLGANVDVVELTPGLIPGCDADVLKPLDKAMRARLRDVWTNTKVTGIEAKDDGLHVSFEGDKAPSSQGYDKVLVAVGRRPNGDRIGADKAGVKVDERGFISVDKQMRTNVKHIFAIGDVAGQPMLAHKATHEGKVAAEVIAGHKVAFDARCIPSVVYTHPEAGWVGKTENQCKEEGIEYEKGQFPWAANGRSLGMGNSEGFTKLLFDKGTGRIIGGAAVGPNAGELMAEVGHAIEMGSDMEDIGLTIHAHPTLSESVGMAAEAAHGTLTDLYMPKKK